MRKLIITILILWTNSVQAQNVTFRGLYAGAQTLTAIKPNEKFNHSVYVLAAAGIKRWTANAQLIQPLQGQMVIKFGVDFCIIKPR